MSRFDFRLFSVLGRAQGATSRSVSSLAPSVKPKFFVSRSQRSNSIQVFDFANHAEERLARKSRGSPTRELNFTPAHWAKHKSVWRRIRHMKTFLTSSPFRRLAFPDLSIVGATAVGLTFYNTEIATDYASMLLLDGSAMAGATTAVGLLTAFRLNGSYGRYNEARKFWGEINNASRDLAGNAMMWMETHEQRDRMLNFVRAFPVSMQWHLNDKGGHPRVSRKDEGFAEQMYAEYYTEMLDIFKDEKDYDFIQIMNAVKTKSHVPLGIVSGMRKIIAESGTWVDPIYNREMDEQCQRLVACMGMCERVLRTPMPTCFTRHTSRLLCIWSSMLPFAMYGACGPVATLPASMMVAYAVLGIEDIGVQLEEPFHILPLRQYSEGIFAGVDSIRDSYEMAGNYADTRDLYEKVSVAPLLKDVETEAAAPADISAQPVNGSFESPKNEEYTEKDYSEEQNQQPQMAMN